MNNVKNQTIKPIAQSTSIAIQNDMINEFNNVFWKKSVYDFYINHKTIRNNFMILEIRSLRINEFLDILDENKIKWSYINFKY